MYTVIYIDNFDIGTNDPYYLAESQPDDEVANEEYGVRMTPMFHRRKDAKGYAEKMDERYCGNFDWKVISVEVELRATNRVKIGLS